MKGFSLMELMASMAIVGILAAVAVPSFIDYSRKGNRSDGLSSLLSIRLAQEKWRSTRTSYTATLGSGGLSFPASSDLGHYTLSITAANATSFTATATATGNQADDTDCAVISINQSGPIANTAQEKECWGQ